MHYNTFSIAAASAVLLAASSSSAAILPVTGNNNHKAGSVARVALVRNENGQLAHLKRSGGINLERRADTASLYNALGREYFIEVGIGTPAQSFNLTLDTGSAELWVPSSACPASSCPYERFDSSKSSTFKGTNTQFKIQYGIGSAEGTYGRDTVTVGNAKVENQTIGLATSTKDILGVVSTGEQANGIFGLGFPGLNSARGASNVTPFPFNLAPKLQDPVFSVFLNKHFSFGYSGEIMFGGMDSSKYSGIIEYVPVASYDLTGYNVSPLLGSKASQKGTYLYWTVPGQGIGAGSYSENFSDLQGLILDTGTTLTMIPQKYVEGILNAIAPGKYTYSAVNGVYSVDCGLASSSETVQIHLSTSTSAASSTPVTITTPVSELVIPLDTDYLETATTCIFGITTSGSAEASSGQTWIVGEATLRAVYAVHDMKNHRVGLAPANFNGKAAVASSSHNSTLSPTNSNSTITTVAGNSTTTNASTSSSPTSSSSNNSKSAVQGSNGDADTEASKKGNSIDSGEESSASSTTTLASLAFAVSLAVSASLLF